MNGITDYLRAIPYVFHRKVIGFALVPAILAALFAGAIYFLVSNFSDDVAQWMWRWYSWDFGRDFIESAGEYITGAIMVALSLFLFKYVILIVSSPFMSPMSERIEEVMTGEPAHVSGAMMLEGLSRGIHIAMRNMVREFGLTFLLLLLSFFPLFAPFTGILLFMVQAYYAGFANMDFTMERYFSVPEAADFVRQNRVYALGNGIVFVALLLIPVAGAVVAVPLGAAAATIGVVERT